MVSEGWTAGKEAGWRFNRRRPACPSNVKGVELNAVSASLDILLIIIMAG